MTTKGLVPAPPDCKWQLCDSAVGGYDFSLRLWHTWDRPDEHGICFAGDRPVSPLEHGYVARETDLHHISKLLVREYQREQARKA